MNRKGFTLVELLATIVILGIVVGLTVAISSGAFNNAKKNTEDIFVKTVTDALDVYLDSDARSLSFNTNASVCTLSKTHGNVRVYKALIDTNFDGTFLSVINSKYNPITKTELVNPANKGNDNYQCFSNDNYGTLNIYRDDDYVYYYKIDKADFKCLNSTGFITNLPSGCNG